MKKYTLEEIKKESLNEDSLVELINETVAKMKKINAGVIEFNIIVSFILTTLILEFNEVNKIEKDVLASLEKLIDHTLLEIKVVTLACVKANLKS